MSADGTGHLDTRHVRHAFARAAASYDAHAALQAEVGVRLRENLAELIDSPRRILDLGCGTGRDAVALRWLFADAELIALDLALPMLASARRRCSGDPRFAAACADAAALPLGDATLDLVHANLCLQWCGDPLAVFGELRRVLRPGGLLVFSTFGPDTLHELRDAFATVDGSPHVGRFIDMHDLGDTLLYAGFRDPVLVRENFTLTYPDPLALMRELRALGATNADATRRRTLTGKTHLRRVLAAYPSHDGDGRAIATFEAVYAQAFAPMPGQPVRTPGGDVASFSVDSLRRSRPARR